MVHRLLQLPGGGQGVDDGVDAKMAIAPEARGREVIEGANTHEDSRRRVHRAFHPFVVSSGTERANHGSEPPLRGDGPGPTRRSKPDATGDVRARSEERRVGKECGARWWQWQ